MYGFRAEWLSMWDIDNTGLTTLAMPTINSSNSSVYGSYVNS